MSTHYTTQDLKDSIAAMEDEDLPLNAATEVHIDGKVYYITSIGHFHIVPNMTIELTLAKPDGSL
jgi:hypothetical protein